MAFPKQIGNEKVSADALAQMRERQRLDTLWMAYQNVALDSCDLGSFRFLQVGEGCTFAEVPARYSDTQFGTGWRHVLVGVVDLETGEIRS